MNKLNQKGVVHLIIPLVLLLLAGIVVGVYLITNGNPLKLFSRATNSPIVFKNINGSNFPTNPNNVPIAAVSGGVNLTANVLVELTSPLGPPSAASASASVSAPNERRTVSYKLAEEAGELNAAPSQLYTAEPKVFTHGFFYSLQPCNSIQKFLWVEFRANDGSIDRRTAQIVLENSCDSVSSPITPSPIPTSVPIPSSSPVVNNAISWKTAQVSLEASNFYIEVGNKRFLANRGNIQLHSDPGNPTYTTLEGIWQENGVEMRMFIYFNSQAGNWNLYELRTYDGNVSGDWVYFYPNISGTLGTSYTNSNLVIPSKNSAGNIHFENLKLQPFLSVTSTPTPNPTATPTQNQGGGGGGGGGGSSTAKTTRTIKYYRVAESVAGLSTASWSSYAQGITVPYEFKDTAPGSKFIFVQFADGTETNKQIILINGQSYLTSSGIELVAEAASTPTPTTAPNTPTGPAPLSSDGSNCPISNPSNYDIGTLYKMCSVDQLARFDLIWLKDFPNNVLIDIGRRKGNLGAFLADFTGQRLLGLPPFKPEAAFGLDILNELPCDRVNGIGKYSGSGGLPGYIQDQLNCR